MERKMIVVVDLDDANSIKEFVYKRTDGDFVLGQKPSEIYYIDFCLPIEAKEEIIAALKERARLKKAYDESMKLIYQIRNKYSTKR